MLPTGTVTFLFTDIEGSTKLWERHREKMGRDLARHDVLLRTCIENQGGYVFKTVGDAFCAAFDRAADALDAAIAAQRALATEPWQVPGGIRVRMALHTGAAEEREGDYFGPALNRMARLLSIGYGRQVLVSLVTMELLRDILPEDIALLDLGPHRLKDLMRPEGVYQVAAPGLGREFPALKSLDHQPNNLPQQPTAFLGREKELEGLQTLLLSDPVRIVTLTGPGGIGKTRLALQVAADLIEHFDDGIYFVDFSAIDTPEHVLAVIARTLGLREATGRLLGEQLRERLRTSIMLLVLDNFEQLMPAVPQLVDLLASGPQVKAIVTSREALHVRGEQVFLVPPLPVPPRRGLKRMGEARLRQYQSVVLFIERAVAVRPEFAVTNANAPAVAEICARLEGLPLAVELAAARISILTPEVLLSQLGNQLAALGGGLVDLPPRQRTLRATIDWSYRLLEDEEQRLLRELAVFVHGADLEAGEGVCACAHEGVQVLPALCSLVEKSLVISEERAGALRFRLMESIREYGMELLERAGGAEALRDAHATWYLKLAERLSACADGPEEPKALETFEADYENFLAAAERYHALGAGTEELRLCAALGLFWQVRGFFSDGRKYLDRALQHSESAGVAHRASALRWAGVLAREQGDLAKAESLLEESHRYVTEIGNGTATMDILLQMASIRFRSDEYGDARRLYHLVLSDQSGCDPLQRAEAEMGVGACDAEEGNLSDAESHFQASRHAFDVRGARRQQLQLTNNLVALKIDQGKLREARALAEEVFNTTERFHDTAVRTFCLNNLGYICLRLGDFARARECYGSLLQDSGMCGNRGMMSFARAGLADSLAGEGRFPEALEQAKAAVRIAEMIGEGHEMGVGLLSLAEVLHAMGRREEAVKQYSRSIPLLEMANDKADLERAQDGHSRALVPERP